MATDREKRTELEKAIHEFIDKHGGEYHFLSGHRKKGSDNHKHHGGLDISAAHIGGRGMQNKLIKFMLKKGFRVVDERDGYSYNPGKRKRGDSKGSIHFDQTPGKHKFVKYLPAGSIYSPKTEEVNIDIKEFDNYEKDFKTVEHGRRSDQDKALHNRYHFKGKAHTKIEKGYKPLRKEGVKSKPKIQYDLSNPFRIPEDKSKVQSWMRKHGYRANDLKKPDGGWYNPGDVLPSPEEVEVKVEKKEEVVRDPYYGTEVDMPKPEISPEQMPLDPPTPYGVYAQDQPEFEEAEKVQMWAANGGEVEYKDSWREEEVEEDYDIPEYLQRPEDKVEEPLIPNVPEVKGFVPVEPPPVEPKPKPELNLIEESKKKVEEFQRPDDEMVKKSYYEIESSLQDIDPKTKRLNPEAKEFLSQLTPKALEEYRETYASGPERIRLNEVLVKQKDDKRKGVDIDITEDDLIKIKTPRKLSELEIRKKRAEKDRKDLIKAEDEAISAAMNLSSIDPERFYKKQSTFDKVVSLIGLAAGGYSAHKYGGPNVYLAELDKEVAKDIQAQKLDQNSEKQKIAAHNFKVATLAKRLARSTKDEDKKANLMKMFLQYKQKGFKASKSIAKDQSKFDLQKASNTRGLTDAEVAKADTLGLKFSDLMIRGRDGLNYKVKGGIARANKVKGYAANAQQTIDGLRDLMGYVDKVQWYKQGAFNPLGRLFSSDVAEAEALRDRLVGNLRIEFFGPGVMTDQERAQAKIILGDPTKLLTTDVREKNKIRNLMMKINYGVRQKLRADGLSFKLSPNESRVEQLLELKKLSNVPFNRRKIIDGLIKAELRAVEAGAKPGTLWDMNEPLPI